MKNENKKPWREGKPRAEKFIAMGRRVMKSQLNPFGKNRSAKKNKPTPGKVFSFCDSFKKIHKGESLSNFKKRRKVCNKRRRVREGKYSNQRYHLILPF